MNDKKVFTVFKDTLHSCLACLSNEDAGKFIKCIDRYQQGEADYSSDSPIVNVCMQIMVDKFKMSEEYYERLSEARRKSALARWENSKSMQSDANACNDMQTDANTCKTCHTNTNTNTNTNTTNNIKEKVVKEKFPQDGPDLSFVSLDMTAAFSEWLEYKRERKQTYKTPRTLKACYDQLVQLSNGDPKVAMKIVNQSIANNYSGLFELKPTSNTSTNGPTTQFERQIRSQQQLGAALAQQCADRIAAESTNAEEGGFVPPDL